MNESPTSTNLQLSSPAYDQIKRVTTVVLPGLATLYFTLAQIWGLPAAEQVVGTITAINLFLGVLLSLSSRSYNADGVAGELNITTKDDGGKLLTLDITQNPDILEKKTEVRFKVNNES